jgi:hypothetical protein
VKQLLDFPRAQRLEAYKAAGSVIAELYGFSCLELEDALAPDGTADAEKDFWGRLFGGDSGDTVETRDDRRPRVKALRERGRLSEVAEREELQNAIHRDAQQTRLMMLAWIHALDEAGDLEDLLS